MDIKRLVAARPEALKLREVQKHDSSVVIYDVEENVAFLRCFKCQRFGHHSVRCKLENPHVGFVEWICMTSVITPRIRWRAQSPSVVIAVEVGKWISEPPSHLIYRSRTDCQCLPNGKPAEAALSRSMKQVPQSWCLSTLLEKYLSTNTVQERREGSWFSLFLWVPFAIVSFRKVLEKIGTDNALHAAYTELDRATAKYVMGVFLDIGGAFDNALWPKILSALWHMHPPQWRRHWRRAAHRDRSSDHCSGTFCLTAFTTLCFLVDAGYWGYADDDLVLVYGNSHRESQQKSQLDFSVPKSKCMMVKEWFRGIYRHPKAELNGTSLEFVKTCTYLGVLLSNKLSFTQYVEYVRNRRLNFKTLFGLYKWVLEPIVMYGSIVSYKRVGHSHIRQKQLSTQHVALLVVTKAYHTVSPHTLQVLSRVAPLDLSDLRHDGIPPRTCAF
ncbi:hypothetical protein PR048_023458 [Dryococelus australis]|uniref:Reverse transcriptase domain-containing protein n=1 Tax=Dryococelus australis TaxID=614101 RepID=A0ABQ9GU65_9NEOP|nr:hypothetical protein PR048_023458 [Dryococelus australis]